MNKSESPKENKKEKIKENWLNIRNIFHISIIVFIISIMTLKLKFYFNLLFSLIISFIVIIFLLHIFKTIFDKTKKIRLFRRMA